MGIRRNILRLLGIKSPSEAYRSGWDNDALLEELKEAMSHPIDPTAGVHEGCFHLASPDPWAPYEGRYAERTAMKDEQRQGGILWEPNQ